MLTYRFGFVRDQVLDSIKPCLAKDPKYIAVLDRIIEPERLFQFRVPWVDDAVSDRAPPRVVDVGLYV